MTENYFHHFSLSRKIFIIGEQISPIEIRSNNVSTHWPSISLYIVLHKVPEAYLKN